MMSSNLLNAVIVVDVPETFRPQRPWDVPPRILGGQLFAEHVILDAALDFAQCFNKRAMRLNLAERQWALVVRNFPNWG
jgi:hypothetical protein